jgi:3-oxoacid CoA-transferase
MRRPKIVSAQEAVSLIYDGDEIGFPNFFSVGIAYDLANALADQGTKNLTMYGNEVGLPGIGVGRLIRQGQIKKVVISFLGTNQEAIDMVLEGKMEYEMYPQGTIISKYMAGASGFGGFLSPVGVGIPEIEAGKKKIWLNGRHWLIEEPLRCRVCLVKGWAADKQGNVIFSKAARNFNCVQARASDITIVEVDEILPDDEYIDPSFVHLPFYHVDYLVHSSGQWEKDLRLFQRRAETKSDPRRIRIAKRAARMLNDGDMVNLGIGIPLMTSYYVPKDISVCFMSQNGIFGMSGLIPEEDQDLEVNNAGREPVGIVPGAVFTDSFEAFAMVRAGKIDKTVLGTIEVDVEGTIANYEIPGKRMPGVGGAMDLAAGAKEVIITTLHTYKGKPKIVKKCQYPLTGVKVARWIITELAVFEVMNDGQLWLREMAHDTTYDEIRAKTEAPYAIASNLKRFGEE